MSNIINVFKISLLIISLVIINSCKKNENFDDDQYNGEYIELSTDKSEIYPQQVLSLYSDIISFNEEYYMGVIGDDSVVAVNRNDTLKILMPFQNEGEYDIKLDLSDGFYGTASIFILKQDQLAGWEQIIEDYNSYLNNAISDIESIPGGASSAEAQLLRDVRSQHDELFAQMSDDEKMQLAYYLNENADWFLSSEIKSGNSDILQTFNFEISKRLVIVGSAAFALAGYYYPNPFTIVAAGVALAVLIHELKDFSVSLFELLEKHIIPYLEEANNMLNEITDLSKTEDLLFKNGTEYSGVLKVDYRTICDIDEAGENVILKELISNINKIRTYWDDAMNTVTRITSLFGLSGGLSEGPIRITEITEYTYITNAVLAESATISILNNNDKVSVEYNDTDTTLYMTFTNNTLYDQSFDFRIQYTENDFVVEQTYHAVVLPHSDPYSIEMVSGNNQSGDIFTELNDPLTIIVKDINGIPVQGAIVTYRVDDIGLKEFDPWHNITPELSYSTVTDQNGKAEAYWILGEDTSVYVTSYKSDGVTLLEGAPLEFYADINTDGFYISAANGPGVLDYSGTLYGTGLYGYSLVPYSPEVTSVWWNYNNAWHEGTVLPQEGNTYCFVFNSNGDAIDLMLCSYP